VGSLHIYAYAHPKMTMNQGILTEGEGSVQVTFSIGYLVLQNQIIFAISKAADLSRLVQGSQLYLPLQ
jgi:hypothetical protein